ncbi:hypothetical protein BKI52_20745 [marine bacterium AO1-C]|nr:hypothetical protein BKI52_20745 [marine bacterium AO1-C]
MHKPFQIDINSSFFNEVFINDTYLKTTNTDFFKFSLFMDLKFFYRLLKILCFSIFLVPQLQAQVEATWNATGTMSGGYYSNLQEKNWYNPANWTWRVGGVAADPTHASVPDNGIPDAGTNVIIPNGTAVCWIPPNNAKFCIDFSGANATNPVMTEKTLVTDACPGSAVDATEPLAASITINGGAIYNQAGSGVGSPSPLRVSTASGGSGNVTISNGGGIQGVLMIETPTTQINGSLDITTNGHFVIFSGEIEVELTQNVNIDGTITKLQTNSNGIFTMNFLGADNSTITGTNKSNVSTALGKLTPYLDFDRFASGAFDNVVMNKEVAQGQDYYIQNADNGMPFLAGVVDNTGALILTSTGNFTVNRGTVIVNNAITTSQTFNGADNWDWQINDPDINIRGKLFIANADVGTVSYKGSSVDLWKGALANKEEITMHLGGSLEDLNIRYPSETDDGQSRGGLYVGPITPSASANASRPVIVFNGSLSQDIRGLGGNGTGDQLQNFAGNASEGIGMVLPNVIYQPASAAQKLTINSSNNLRIIGHLLITQGTFSLNNQTLLFGDAISTDLTSNIVTTYDFGDEINVYGTFELTPSSTLKMSTGGTGQGTIMRIRNGGRIESIGTANQNVSITRDGVPGNYYRIGAYSGSTVRITYTLFELIASSNNGYRLINTGVGSDYTRGGTNSSGGFKCYPGSTLSTDIDHDADATTANVASFSYCGFSFGAPGVTFLTLNSGQNLVIERTLFGDTGNNLVCTSNTCTPSFRNVVSNDAGTYEMSRSSGSSGGSAFGEFNDGGGNDGNITWTGPTPIYWLGPRGVTQNGIFGSAFKDNTAYYRKWSDSNGDGTPDNLGWSLSPTSYIVIDGTSSNIPGKTAGFLDYDIYVPSTCSRNLLIDDDYTITGGYFFLEAFSSTSFNDGIVDHYRYANRGVYLDDNRTLTLGGDFSNTGSNSFSYNYVGGYFYAGTNSTLNVAGSFFTSSGRSVEGEQASSRFEAFTGSTVVLNGAGDQELRLRTNSLYNLTINKASGNVLAQGLSGATYYSIVVQNKFSMLSGNFVVRSTCPLVIQGDYEQQGGTVDFDLSPVTVQGNFIVTGGTLTPTSSTVYFTPNSSTDRTIQLDGSSVTLNNVVFNRDGYIPTAGHNSPGNHLTDPAVQTTIPVTTVNTGLVRYTISSTTNTFEVLNDITIENNRDVTLAEDLSSIIGNITVNSGGELTTSAGTDLQIRAGKTLLVDDGGSLNVIGSVSKYTKLSRNGTGDDKFSFTVNGTLRARYYLIEHTDVNGVNLGTTAKTLSPGVTIVGGGGENYDVTTGVTVVGGGGIGATATPSIKASITQINLTNQGGGYTTVPTITIDTSPTGVDATATAVIKGPITGMYVSDGAEYDVLPTGVVFNLVTANGSGASGIVKGGIKNITLGTVGAKYASAPTVSFTGGGGAGASASTVLSAEVASIAVVDGGEGYDAVPGIGDITIDNSSTNNTTNMTVTGVTATVTGAKNITPGSGYDGTSTVTIDGGTFTTQATATLDIATTGQLLSVNLISGGVGTDYLGGGSGTFALVITGGGTPTTTATAQATVVSGIITRIDVTNVGAGYTSAPAIDLETNGGRSVGTAASATPVYAPSGGIKGIIITNPGSGYTSAPTGLTFGGPGVSGNFTPTMSIESVTVGTGGSGYEIGPSISVIAPATATDIPTRTATLATNLSGTVKSISLDNPGTGYTSTPTLTIQSPGAEATATVASGAVTSITVTNGGGNYTSVPAVTFSSGSATATAVVVDGVVTQIVVTNGGSGYATAPTVTIAPPTGSVQATATFTMQITEVTLASGGQNYDLPPTITLTGGTTTGAGPDATIQPTMSVQSITLTNSGTEYGTAPNVGIQSPDAAGIGIANGAIQATATVETVGEIESIGVTAGSGYTGTPFVIITDPTGNGRGAAATALLTHTTLASVVVIDGGHYTQKPTVTYTGGLDGGGTAATTAAADITMVAPSFNEISSAKINAQGTNCTNGTYDVIVTEGVNTSATLLVTVVDNVVASVLPKIYGTGYLADVDVSTAVNTDCGCDLGSANVTALKGSRISTIGVTSAGNLYNGTPTVVITPQASDTEAGDGAAIAYLNATTISSIALTTKNVYPAATFSDGIFTNGYNRDNVGGTVNGTFITFPENYTTYRDNSNTYSTTETLPASVTHDYTATPVVDTIYNVIFPQNPTRLSNPFNTNNVRRNGTGTNVENQVVFKDALGTFSGEDYDDEQNNNDMVVWVEPNIVRWDGGPNNSGTAWSNPNNWRPNGVPTPDKNVIIDYTYAALQSNNVLGPSTIIAPTPLRVDFDLDPLAYPITCRSLTIETLIPGLNPTNARGPIFLDINQDMTVLESFSASSGTTIEVFSARTMNIGGSWSNEGVFKNGGGTVNFNQPLTRTINAASGIVESYSATPSTSTATVGMTDDDANAFFNLILSDGTTELNSYIRVENNLTIQNAGTRFNPSNSNFTIELWGNWQNEGTFDPSQGKVIFAAFNGQTVGKGFRTAATATATVSAGSLTGLTVTGVGDKYATAPKVVFEGGGGYGASATATIDGNGQINSLTIDPGGNGTGYTTAPNVVFVPVDKEDFYNVDVYKGLTSHVTLLTRTEISNSLDFRLNNIISDTLRECIVRGNVTATGGYVDGPMGRVYNSTALSTQTYSVGKGTKFPGDVSLQIALDNNPDAGDASTVVYMMERHNNTPITGRNIPAAVDVNILLDAYYQVYQVPYPLINSSYPVTSGGTPINFNSVGSLAPKIGIPLDLTVESLTTQALAGVTIDLSTIAVANLDNYRIFIDPGDNTPVNASDPIKGLDVEVPYHSPGSDWVNLGGENTVNANIGGSTVISSINTFDKLGSGVFSLAIKYTALPVGLVTLAATPQGQRVYLRWTSLAEKDVSHYELERSTDGENFTKFGEQTALGNDELSQSYQSVDNNPINGINYYRLKIWDKDGKFNYSKIVSASINPGAGFLLYPNPNNGSRVTINSEVALPEEDIQLTIIDLSGKIVYRKLMTTSQRTSTHSIELESLNLSSGNYFINLKSASLSAQLELVISK